MNLYELKSGQALTFIGPLIDTRPAQISALCVKPLSVANIETFSDQETYKTLYKIYKALAA